jgi:hypothetical protein
MASDNSDSRPAFGVGASAGFEPPPSYDPTEVVSVTDRTSVVIEPGVSVLHLIECGSVVEYLTTGNVKPATGTEVALAEQCVRLRETALRACDLAESATARRNPRADSYHRDVERLRSTL